MSSDERDEGQRDHRALEPHRPHVGMAEDRAEMKNTKVSPKRWMCDTRTSVKMPVPVSRSVIFFTLSKPSRLARCGLLPSWQPCSACRASAGCRFSYAGAIGAFLHPGDDRGELVLGQHDRHRAAQRGFQPRRLAAAAVRDDDVLVGQDARSCRPSRSRCERDRSARTGSPCRGSAAWRCTARAGCTAARRNGENPVQRHVVHGRFSGHEDVNHQARAGWRE